MAKPCAEPWTKLQGAKRIQAELKAMQKSRSLADQLSDLTLVNDDLFRWRFRVKNFDVDVPAGKQLNLDLQECGQKYGQDYILMEVIFPPDYPTNPFFLRVVSPRCVMYTGHVTAGGSICIEALVPTGGPGGWRPEYGLEGVLMLVLANMLHAEVALVRTPTGPGGTSGPLRVDLSRGRHCVSEYSMAEAEAAYSRTVANHGWPVAAAGAAGSGTAAAMARGGAGGIGTMLTATARNMKALAISVQVNAAAAVTSLAGVTTAAACRAPPVAMATAAADQAPARCIQTRSKAAQAAAVHASGVSHNGPSAGGAGPSAAVFTNGGNAVRTRNAIAASVTTAAPVTAAAAGAAAAAKIVIVLDDEDDDDHKEAGGAGRRSSVKNKAPAQAAERDAAKRAARPATRAKPKSTATSVDSEDNGAGDVSAAAATGTASTAAMRQRPPQPSPRPARKRSLRDRDDSDGSDVEIMSPLGKGSGPANPVHGRRGAAGESGSSRVAAVYVVDLTSVDVDQGSQEAPTRCGGCGGPGSSAAAPVGRITAAARTTDGVEVVDLTGSSAAGGNDGCGVLADAAAHESTDAALAALLAQLEEARAKLEEEQRAKKRLEDKVQNLAAKALFAGRQGGSSGGAGPSSGAGPSGSAPAGGPSKPIAGGSASDVLLSAPLPPHWEPLRPEEGSGVKMVVLPLPGDALAGTSAVAAPGSGALAAGPAHPPGDVAELVANGLSHEDATDLLTHCNGSLEEAWELAMQAADCGGIMVFLKQQRKAAAESSQSDPAASAADRAAAKAAREREELQVVLARFEKASGLSRSSVVRVERVQNWRLWTKYCIRKREIEARLNATQAANPTAGGLASGSGVNEFLLWHGTSKPVVELVVKDGFDLRESNRAGALGEGTYFAANALYSVGYVNRIPAAVAAAAQQSSSAVAFPGSSALMLCRVALGTMARGGPGLRKPPAGADSVYMANTMQMGATKTATRDPAAAAKLAATSTDPAWDVGSALGDNLIVAVFDNTQAYPEYIVHLK